MANEVRHEDALVFNEGVQVFHGPIEVSIVLRPIAALRMRAPSDVAVLRTRHISTLAARHTQQATPIAVLRTRED